MGEFNSKGVAMIPMNGSEIFCSYNNLCDTLSTITDKSMEQFRIKVSKTKSMNLESLGKKFEIVIDDTSGRIQVTMNILFHSFIEGREVRDTKVSIAVRTRKYEEITIPAGLALLPALVTVPSMMRAPVSERLTIPPTTTVQKIAEAYTSVFKTRGIDFECEFLTPRS